MTVRVLVVDDNALLRAGLVTVLCSDSGLELVGEAEDGPGGVRVALKERPDVVLMDVEMPGGDGITATRVIVEALPETRVLILTMFDLDEYVVEALRAGASGYLLKTADPDRLLSAVHACAAGETTVGPSVMNRLVETYVGQARAGRPEPGIDELTGRELDVLRSMAKGHSNSEVAADLFLSETTVKTHVARILQKLGARDRLQAVVTAYRAGLAAPSALRDAQEP